jgi:hypothetical protein
MSSTAVPQPPPQKTLCSPFPNFEPFSVPLPFGGILTSIVDPSKGPPTDCTLAHSLMLQIMPMLSGLTCILRILNVIKAIEGAATATPPILGGVDDILKAIGKMKDCFGFFNPENILAMIKAILQMLLAYLNCMLTAMESLLNLKAQIGISGEGGTPLLLNTLQCSSNNADIAMSSMMSSMGAVQPLMDLVSMVASIVELNISMPSLSISATSPGQDPLQPIRDFVTTLQEVVQAIPA